MYLRIIYRSSPRHPLENSTYGTALADSPGSQHAQLIPVALHPNKLRSNLFSVTNNGNVNGESRWYLSRLRFVNADHTTPQKIVANLWTEFSAHNR